MQRQYRPKAASPHNHINSRFLIYCYGAGSFPFLHLTKCDTMADFTPLERNRQLNAHVAEEQTMPGLHQRILPLVTGERILDLGCGSGHFSRLLPDKKFSLVDCLPRPGLNNIVLDLSHDTLPFKDGAFDTILLLEVAEHLENPWHAVREAKRCGRSLIISTPVVDDLRNKLIYLLHGRFFFFFNDDNDHIQPLFRKQLDWMRGDWTKTEEFVYGDGSGGKTLIQKWARP